MKRRRLTLLVAAVVLTGGLSALFFLTLRGFLRESLLEPILQRWFVIRWYVGRISQALLWNVLTLGGGILLLRAVLRRRSRGPLREGRPPSLDDPTDELDRLTRTIRLAQRRRLYRALLKRDLAGIAIRLVGRREGLSPNEAHARLLDVRLHGKLGVAAFFADQNLEQMGFLDTSFTRNLDETLSFLEGYFKEA